MACNDVSFALYHSSSQRGELTGRDAHSAAQPAGALGGFPPCKTGGASVASYRFPPEHIVDVVRQHRLMDAPGDGGPAPAPVLLCSADRPQEAASKDYELGIRGAGGTTPDRELGRPLSVVGCPVPTGPGLGRRANITD